MDKLTIEQIHVIEDALRSAGKAHRERADVSGLTDYLSYIKLDAQKDEMEGFITTLTDRQRQALWVALNDPVVMEYLFDHPIWMNYPNLR